MITASKPKLKTAASTQNKPYFLGVDVGGTNIKIGLVDDMGKTLACESIDTRATENAQQAIERAAETCRQLVQLAGVAWTDVAAAGLGTPGPLSLAEGCLLDPSNLPAWHNFHARQSLEKALEKPVSFINDANAAALGEAWTGAGLGHLSLALFTLGTGVGGGLISEGRLINGVNSFGSEMGHMVVDSRPDARLCVWGGGRGQLEAYASASAVAAQAMLGVKSGVESSLCRLGKAGPIDDEPAMELTAKDVYQAALEGDSFALELIDEAAFYLGIGVTTAVHMIDPGLVLFGGAMNFGGSSCPVGRRFLQRAIDEFERRTFGNVFAGTRIEFATLGGDAGYIGAAAYARQEFQGN
ncbi:MAG: ROK family protein [Planctomycetales bacterium]|nr:ROK family protein [Planctomycetales bacterium]